MDNTTAKGGVSPLATPDTRTASQVAMADAVEALIPPPARAKRGFAVLSPEKKREIASMGGKAAHEHGRAHRFTSEKACAAGKKRHQMRVDAAASSDKSGPSA